MKQSLLFYFLFIAFSAFFLSQQTFAQVNTIDFNDLSNNLDLGREYSRDGFTFAINIPDGPPGTPVIVSRNDGSGFEGTACLYDNNLAEGALTQWTITRNDGTGFQFRSIFLQEAGVGASTSGTIQGFKNGNPTGPAKPIQFNSSIAGLKDYAGDSDFYDVDEIQIKAEDINFFLDHFTYGPPFTPVEATVSFEDATYVFDGTERTIEITGTLPDGASVAYQNNTRTNVGTQEATATITGNNFSTLVLTADLTITRANFTGISFEDASFVFDGTEKSIEITGTLPDGASVAYLDNTQTNVGTQEATATITGSNFSTLVLTADLTITPASLTGITLEDASFVFDGTEKSIEITGTLPDGASVTYENNARTNVGTQEATATITGDNFTTLVLTAELEITPALEPSEVILLTPTDEEMDVELIPELTWGAADGADTYELQLSENSDFSDPVIDEEGLTETSFQITDALDVSTLYYWQVRGVNSGGPGEWSEAFTFTTVPEVPQVVILESPDDGAVNQSLSAELTWQPSERAETYTLTLSENEDLTDPVIEAVSLEQTSFTPDKPLNRESTYYWAVIAVNPGGQSKSSEVWSFTTVPEASEVVILLTPANEAMDVVLTPELTWNPADGADTYELQLSENADFTDPEIDVDGLEETNFQMTDALDVSTLYYWQVRGVNPGGPGQWSDPFTFTTRALPEAGHGRVLVSNQSSLYIFNGADFGLTDAAYSIRIESVSGGGTLSVDADDQLTIGQINSDALTYKPAPGQHGYGFAWFEFTVIDDAGLKSDDTYTMSIDLAATSVELTGGKGWRFLTSPSIGNTFGDFLTPIIVQGVPGSDNPGARDASLYTLNQEEYQWELPDAMSDEIDPGKGFIVFGFEDDIPATLTSGQNWLQLDGEYGYEGLFYDPDQGPEGDSHFLLANPHPISLDFCEFFAFGVANNIHIWDPGINDGDYLTLSCFNGGAEIAPFQAFWIRTLENREGQPQKANITLGDPFLAIPENAYLGSATEGYFKQTPDEDLFRIALNLTEEREGFTNKVLMIFTEEGTMGMDHLDAPKLSAAGLAPRWLNFHAMDEDQKSYAIRSLPVNFGDQITIPLGIETTQAGGYTLSWELPHRSVFGGSYFLRDTQTGAITELSEGQNYRFDVDESHASKASNSPLERGSSDACGDAGVCPSVPGAFAMATEQAPRFELLIAQPGVDGYGGLGDLPTSITLNQNYPNPFNPTTIISYELPQTEQVRLDVFDMTGRQVATLVNGQVAAGRHQVSFNAMNLSSGVYMYRLQAGGTILTRQLTLIK